MMDQAELTMCLMLTMLGCFVCVAWAKCKEREEEIFLEGMSELSTQGMWQEDTVQDVIPHAVANNVVVLLTKAVRINDIESNNPQTPSTRSDSEEDDKSILIV